MRRFLCAILSILILGSSIITKEFFNVFTFAESNVISSDSTNIYPQNLYVAEQYSENFDNIFVGTDSSSYARTYYNSMLNDDAFITGIVTWESIHIATSPSYSLESGMFTKADFYRTALFDYLTVQIESNSTGEYFENIYKQVKNEYTSFIVSSTKTIMGKEKNISANELKTLKLTEDRKQLLLNGTWLGQSASTISDVMTILGLAKNCYDAIELIAKYCVLTDLHDGTKEILSYIANDSSNPIDLRIAAQDCAECMGDSYEQAFDALLNGSYSLVRDLIGECVNDMWKGIMTKTPGSAAVFLTFKGLRAVLNLIDSKDAKVKAYYQIEASVKCEDAILKAMSAYRSKFNSNKTQENAVLYLKAAEMYKSVVLLGYDYSVDLLDIVNNSTSALIFNQTEDCTTLIKDIKAFKADKQSNYERFDTATLNAYKETYFPDYDQLESSANTTYYCPFSYTVNNGTVTITKYNGSASTVRIPELINNYPVTSIGDKAFYKYKTLTNITIPNGVTSIGDYAFYYCEGLTSIKIPDSVISMGKGIFSNCYYLKNVNIPHGITSIDDYAFNGCYYLTSINIPDSVTRIGCDAFYNCDNLTNVVLPESIITIDAQAFYNCTNLASINIPDSVISIGNSAFRDCISLTSIIIPDGVVSIENYVFSRCERLTNVTIPDSVTSVGNCAFMDCNNLTSINIPDGVTSIGSSAFVDCTSLTNIIIPDSVTYIGNTAFGGCVGLESIDLSENLSAISSSMFLNCTKLETIIIPDSVTSIDYDAFYKCANLSTVGIGKGVSDINSSVFDKCINLNEINVSTNNTVYSSIDGVVLSKDQTVLIFCPQGKSGTYVIPESVISIKGTEERFWREMGDIMEGDYGAFDYCSKLTKIIFPEGLEEIGECAFYGCSGLTTVTLPSSVTKVGSWAFRNCKNIKRVDIIDPAAWCNINFGSTDANPIYSGADVYIDNRLVTDFVVPRNVSQLNARIFSGNSSIKTVTISEGVTNIGDYAFADCDSLTGVTISDSVTNIGNYTFDDCDALTDVIIGRSVNSIGYYAFEDCECLANITIPDSVAVIGYGAFYGCNGLSGVTFGDNVKGIGNYAFKGCDSLTVFCPYNSYADNFAQTNGINRIIFGDYNQDYIVNASDMSVMRKYLMASIESEQPDMVLSDCNRDGLFDIRDLVRLKKQSATA